MNIEDINTTCFILALIIRDDGERILLGDGFYEFKDSLQHFQPNTFQNDIVELQGTDGQLLAGQVRRTASQPFDGFIGDATTNREIIEQKRREFIAFFRKKHYYTVVYIFPNGTTIQRERGYIVDAPSAPELWQKFPEYHIALNFEDPNYYEYEEDESGAEIYAHEADIRILADFSGGLVWDYDGAVSSIGVWSVEQILEGALIQYANPLNVPEPFTSNFQLKGVTEQTTYTGKNLWGGFSADFTKAVGGITLTTKKDGTITTTAGTSTAAGYSMNTSEATNNGFLINLKAGTYTLSGGVSQVVLSVSAGGQEYRADSQTGKITFALVSDTTGFVRITIANGATISAQTIKPMFEVGSTASDYEPYTGSTSTQIVPSPNPDYPQTVNVVSGEQTVKITGKNLFDFQEFVSENIDVQEVQRGTATYTDNSITLTATANDCYTRYNFSQNIPPVIHVQKNTDYTLSWKSSQASSPTFKGMVYVFGKNATGGADIIKNSQDKVEKCQFNTGNYDAITFRLGVNTAGDSLTYSDIQLEFGTEPSAYEPYQGTQSYEINLGKNLIKTDNLSTRVSGGLTTEWADNVGDTTGTASGTSALITDSITTGVSLPIGTYTFSVQTATTQVMSINLYNADTSSWTVVGTIPVGSSKCTFTTTFKATGWRIGYSGLTANTSYTLKCDRPMLEAGTQATSYSAHFTPLELCKIGNYVDRPFKNTPDSDLYDANLDEGAWYIRRAVGKVVLDGSNDEDWAITNTGTPNFFYRFREIDNLGGGGSGTIFGFCNIASPNTLSSTNTLQGYCFIASTHNDIRIRYGTEQTVADWRTFLASEPLIAYYPLATPTNEKITEQALIDDLEAIVDNGKWFAGVNNAFLIPAAGPQGEMRIGFYTDYDPSGEGYEWEFGTVNPQNIITVEGIDRTLPIWEVQGPATNPTLTNATTNQSITWEGTVPSGQTLTVDMANQTATMEGANVFAGIEGEWIELAVGNNIISYTATGATEPSKLKWNGVVG